MTVMGPQRGQYPDSTHNPSYQSQRASFKWQIPERFNIGFDVCEKWALVEPDRTAIIDGATLKRTSFGVLDRMANRIANLLVGLGLTPGDRIAVMAPQRVETAAAHIAGYKAGAIVVPLFTLFGHDAVRHRLRDSGARIAIVDRDGYEKIDAIRAELPALEHMVCIDDDQTRSVLEGLAAPAGDHFTAIATLADDPALAIYTSGTTGSSKGALHAHRVLLGHLPGVEMSHNGFPRTGDCMWTPADWAWIGGLLDVLLPSLHHGVPVVAHRFSKFDAEAAFALVARAGIRNMFLPPTAIKMMRTIAEPKARWPFELRSVASGGEALGGELLDWGRSALGVTINEFYGQTECNMVVSSCDSWFPARPGSIGKAVPGHRVTIVDEDGEQLPLGVEGDIAIGRPDPVMFLGYLGSPEATAEKFRRDWLLTGDRGTIDADGYIRFLGRADDIITSAGYRIGPGEIEDCLLRHPAVQAAGVVGVPDADRTEIVSAFIVLKPDCDPSDELARQLQDHVRSRLGAHQYPRRVRFVRELPLTATGKIMRRQLREMATA